MLVEPRIHLSNDVTKPLHPCGFRPINQLKPIKDARDFEAEQNRLIAYLSKTQQLGEKHFNNKESHSFGNLNKDEWNTMFYKHLDHHLGQFGV